MNDNPTIRTILNKFQELHGKMSFYCFNEYSELDIVSSVIAKFKNKRPNARILIVTDTYERRMATKNSLDNTDGITLMTIKYINTYYNYHYDLVITIGVDELIKLEKFNRECKFGLVILTKHINDQSTILAIRNIYKDAGVNIPKKDNLTQPVEGIVHTVSMSDDDKVLFKKYDEYISDSVKIFGDIDAIKHCRMGSQEKSAAAYRDEIAKLNGWSNTMDTTIEFYKQIDDMYNPNALLDRAMNFFSIADKRRKLLQNNDAKLPKIFELVDKYTNENKSVLIVSKTDEFATKIAEYLEASGISCGQYHDNIPDMLATDKYGNAITYKTGVNKGKVKVLKSKAISTLYEQQFNDGIIKVLSIKSSSYNQLNIAYNSIIFTTSIMPNILEFRQRFKNVKSIEYVNDVQYIITDTILEKNALQDTNNLPFVKLENIDEKIEQFDENNLDIIL